MILKSLLLFSILWISCLDSKAINHLKQKFYTDPIFSQLKSQAILNLETVSAYCFINANGTIFDLNPLYKQTDDYNVTFPNNNVFPNNDTLSINICRKANKNCPNKNALATYIIGQNRECIALSGDENTFLKYQIECKIIKLRLVDNSTNKTTLKAILPPGDICKTSSSPSKTNYQLIYKLICDKNTSNPIFDASLFNINNCSNEITFTTKQGI